MLVKEIETEGVKQLMRGELRDMGILARLTVMAYLLIIAIVLGVICAYVLLIKRWPVKSLHRRINKGR